MKVFLQPVGGLDGDSVELLGKSGLHKPCAFTHVFSDLDVRGFGRTCSDNVGVGVGVGVNAVWVRFRATLGTPIWAQDFG